MVQCVQTGFQRKILLIAPSFTQLPVKIDQNLNKLANISFPIFVYLTNALIFPRKFVTAKTNKL